MIDKIIEPTNLSPEMKEVADYIFRSLAQTLGQWDKERNETKDRQDIYLENNIKALIQGMKDVGTRITNIDNPDSGSMAKLNKKVDTLLGELMLARLYMNFQNTFIRILLAVALSTLVFLGIHYFLPN